MSRWGRLAAPLAHRVLAGVGVHERHKGEGGGKPHAFGFFYRLCLVGDGVTMLRMKPNEQEQVRSRGPGGKAILFSCTDENTGSRQRQNPGSKRALLKLVSDHLPSKHPDVGMRT